MSSPSPQKISLRIKILVAILLIVGVVGGAFGGFIFDRRHLYKPALITAFYDAQRLDVAYQQYVLEKAAGDLKINDQGPVTVRYLAENGDLDKDFAARIEQNKLFFRPYTADDPPNMVYIAYSVPSGSIYFTKSHGGSIAPRP